MSVPRAHSVPPQESTPEEDEDEEDYDEPEKEQVIEPIVEEPAEEGVATRSPKVAEKYFIVKSLTLQDLELSVRNGIWATQSHNEETLNKAFQVRPLLPLAWDQHRHAE